MNLLDVAPDAIDTRTPTGPLLASPSVTASITQVDALSLIDRDQSLVAFQRRVLEEAQDENHPLLERVKFLAILGTNIDELRMVRGARWRAQRLHSRHIHRALLRLLREGHAVLQERLVPELARNGIHLCHYADLTPDERADVDARFVESVLPLIAAQFCDPDTLCPHVPNLGLNFAVQVRRRTGRLDLAFVRVPEALFPLLPFERTALHIFRDGAPASAPQAFVWLEEVLAANLKRLVADATVEAAHLFRVVRAADIETLDQNAPDLPERVAAAVRKRETNPIVAVIVTRTMPAALIKTLIGQLAIEKADVFRAHVVFDLRRLWDVSNLKRSDLHESVLTPRVAPSLQGRSIFDAIRAGDILLHHPYESFQPVVSFFQQAALDPDVEEISATLYRVDRDVSPIGNALLEAAARGKRVRVLVELKARFDEHRNAEWARALRRAGAQVIHGFKGLKVHGKLGLVVRREGANVRRYVHLSTGNYSAFMAKVYSDLGLLTCSEDVGADASDLFATLAREQDAQRFRTLIVAPFTLRERVCELVEREVEWARRGEPAHLVLKMNALVDRKMAALLQHAATVGVDVDLIVRGVCCLRPVTDRIRVRSIVGRFLEHSRIWYFRNGGHDEVYIGSADLMPRNLDRRIEVMAPLNDPSLARRVRGEILALYLADNVKARELQCDGSYRRVAPRPGQPTISSQEAFLTVRPCEVLG